MSTDSTSRRTTEAREPAAQLAKLAFTSARVGQVFLASPKRTIALDPGEYVIGRSAEADLQFADDPLMSRRHARLVVKNDTVEIEDLGSFNGTLIDSVLVQHRLRVPTGSRLRIGSQDFVLRRSPSPRVTRDTAPTARDVPVVRDIARPDEELHVEGPTYEQDPVALVQDDADKALREGRVVAARDLIEPLLEFIGIGQRTLSAEALERVSLLALRLTLATGDAAYADWVVSECLRRAVPLSGPVGALLEEVAFEVDGVDYQALGEYLSLLRRRAPDWGPELLLLCDRIAKAAERRGTTLPGDPPSRA